MKYNDNFKSFLINLNQGYMDVITNDSEALAKHKISSEDVWWNGNLSDESCYQNWLQNSWAKRKRVALPFNTRNFIKAIIQYREDIKDYDFGKFMGHLTDFMWNYDYSQRDRFSIVDLRGSRVIIYNYLEEYVDLAKDLWAEIVNNVTAWNSPKMFLHMVVSFFQKLVGDCAGANGRGKFVYRDEIRKKFMLFIKIANSDLFNNLMVEIFKFRLANFPYDEYRPATFLVWNPTFFKDEDPDKHIPKRSWVSKVLQPYFSETVSRFTLRLDGIHINRDSFIEIKCHGERTKYSPIQMFKYACAVARSRLNLPIVNENGLLEFLKAKNSHLVKHSKSCTRKGSICTENGDLWLSTESLSMLNSFCQNYPPFDDLISEHHNIKNKFINWSFGHYCDSNWMGDNFTVLTQDDSYPKLLDYVKSLEVTTVCDNLK